MGGAGARWSLLYGAPCRAVFVAIGGSGSRWRWLAVAHGDASSRWWSSEEALGRVRQRKKRATQAPPAT